jgi:aryl-alcohol dehydrogenase-like predicted oxidoreductase
MKPEALNSFFDEIKSVLDDLHSYGKELPGMLLKYCLQKPFVDKVIIGVNNIGQLTDNIKSVNIVGDLTKNYINIRSDILTPSKWPKK